MSKKTVKFNALAEEARFLMEDRGHGNSDLVHVFANGMLSSPITLEDYQRGGYVEAYYALGDVAKGCLPCEELEVDVELPRSECPKEVWGAFQRVVVVYTLDKSGVATLVGCSNDCTYHDDAPAVPFEIPAAPRILIEFHTFGNSSRIHRRLYA